jgi:glycosyltransferase involved in cell wall biosynthesis
LEKNLNFDDFSLLVTCFNKQEYVPNFSTQVEIFLKNRAHVLIVDDGSTDQSNLLLAPILEKYDNCRVIRTDNRGSAAARNLTLSNLETEYFMFWDIDDDLDPESVFEALDCFKQTNSDYAVTNFLSIPENTQGKMPLDVISPTIVDMSTLSPHILEAVGYWRYLYRKSVTLDKMTMRFVPTRNEIDNPKFILDDLFWTLEISLQNAKLLVFPVNLVTYRYRTHSIQSEESWKRYQNQVIDLPHAAGAFDNYLNLKNSPKVSNRYRLLASTLIQHYSYLNMVQKVKFLLNLVSTSLQNLRLLRMAIRISPILIYNLLRDIIRIVLISAKLR